MRSASAQKMINHYPLCCLGWPCSNKGLEKIRVGLWKYPECPNKKGHRCLRYHLLSSYSSTYFASKNSSHLSNSSGDQNYRNTIQSCANDQRYQFAILQFNCVRYHDQDYGSNSCAAINRSSYARLCECQAQTVYGIVLVYCEETRLSKLSSKCCQHINIHL